MVHAKILISACLLGQPVRYDGGAKSARHPALSRWQAEGRLVPVCPELSAGFPVPRSPAEIAGGRSGQAVLARTARVITAGGADVSDLFIVGAEAALSLAREHGCRFAILTDGSPSCGSRFIYDGSFGGGRHDGVGVTTALLRAHGVQVFAESGIGELQALLGEADMGN